MAKEIERKFLVISEAYKDEAIACHDIRQGYLCTDPDSTVRIRIRDDEGFITVKTRNQGCVRNEWEFPVDVSQAREMLAACNGTVIEKRRWIVPAQSPVAEGLVWEVDEFFGFHAGLTVAEIELPDPSTPFNLAAFVGREVTGDPAYYNSTLSKG